MIKLDFEEEQKKNFEHMQKLQFENANLRGQLIVYQEIIEKLTKK
jgi:hypothetical protein